MDDDDPKSLPPSERFKNLCHELAEGAFSDDTPLSPQERREAVELRTKLVEFAKAYGTWVEADRPLWGERAVDKNERSGGGKDR